MLSQRNRAELQPNGSDPRAILVTMVPKEKIYPGRPPEKITMTQQEKETELNWKSEQTGIWHMNL